MYTELPSELDNWEKKKEGNKYYKRDTPEIKNYVSLLRGKFGSNTKRSKFSFDLTGF